MMNLTSSDEGFSKSIQRKRFVSLNNVGIRKRSRSALCSLPCVVKANDRIMPLPDFRHSISDLQCSKFSTGGLANRISSAHNRLHTNNHENQFTLDEACPRPGPVRNNSQRFGRAEK